jgi:phosphoglycolate phosphatase
VDVASARNLVGHGAQAMIEHGFANAGQPLGPDRSQALLDRFIPLYVDRIADESTIFPGCLETLGALRGAGARLCVCTNKLTSLARALLMELAIDSYFDAVVGPDATVARKPDPRHLLDAIAAAGGEPGRAVYVGDSRPDALAAFAAGVPSIGVTFGYTDTPVAELGFDTLIDAYDQLAGACARLLDGRAGGPCPPGRATLHPRLPEMDA